MPCRPAAERHFCPRCAPFCIRCLCNLSMLGLQLPLPADSSDQHVCGLPLEHGVASAISAQSSHDRYSESNHFLRCILPLLIGWVFGQWFLRCRSPHSLEQRMQLAGQKLRVLVLDHQVISQILIGLAYRAKHASSDSTDTCSAGTSKLMLPGTGS